MTIMPCVLIRLSSGEQNDGSCDRYTEILMSAVCATQELSAASPHIFITSAPHLQLLQADLLMVENMHLL